MPMPRKKTATDRKTEADLKALLRETGADAVAFLVTLIKDEEAKPELRFKAAEEILDRVLSAEAPVSNIPGSVTFEGVLDEWSK